MVQSVVIIPATNIPSVIAGIALLYGMPKRYAHSAPVQPPVPGRGIATKAIRASSFQSRNLFSYFFLVRSKSHSKKRAKNFERELKYLLTLSKQRSAIVTDNVFPTKDIANAFCQLILKKPIPKGIEALSSPTGLMDKINT